MYSSTQHAEEESHRDPNEKSQDNLHFGGINNTQLLIRKKDPSFLETLYNHRAKIDNDRVTNARRRLEEKYSTSKWKINNELMNTAFRKTNFTKTQKLPNEVKTIMASSGTGFYQNSTPPNYNSGSQPLIRQILLQSNHWQHSRLDAAELYDEHEYWLQSISGPQTSRALKGDHRYHFSPRARTSQVKPIDFAKAAFSSRQLL